MRGLKPNFQRKVRFNSLFFAIVVFAFSLWYLYVSFEWKDAIRQLSGINLLILAIQIWVVHFAFLLIRTLRLNVLLQNSQSSVSFINLYWTTALSLSLSLLTPGQIGEALKIEFLHRFRYVNRRVGFGLFAFEKAVDISVLASIGLASLIFSIDFLWNYPSLWIGITMLTIAGFLYLIIFKFFGLHWYRDQRLDQVYKFIINSNALIKTVILSFIAWIFVVVSWQIAFYAVDIKMSTPQVACLISLITFGSLMSFIPGGLGILEFLTLEALIKMGLEPISAQAGAMILRIQWLMLIIFGLVHLLLFSALRYFNLLQNDSEN